MDLLHAASGIVFLTDNIQRECFWQKNYAWNCRNLTVSVKLVAYRVNGLVVEVGALGLVDTDEPLWTCENKNSGGTISSTR